MSKRVHKPTTESAKLRSVSWHNREKAEQRRLKAAELFEQGKSRAYVARELGVKWESANRWFKAWKNSGVEALRSRGATGNDQRLGEEQLELVRAELLRGARAHGYETDLWTHDRIAAVIERVTGVHYHPHYMTTIIKRLGWSRQRPAKRARERNQEIVDRFMRETWPLIKKGL